MWQLAGIALLALSAWGFIAAHDANQREIGAAQVEAKLAQERADIEADIARANQEGKLKALALLAASRKRNAEADAKAATDALARRAESDARASDDLEYALWRESRVPAYPADRLRRAIVIAPADAARGQLPTGTAVSPGASIPAAAGSVDESWLARIRRVIGHPDPSGVGGGGPGAR